MVRKLLLLAGVFLASGCSWPVRQNTDQMVRELVSHPFDVAPDRTTDSEKPSESGTKEGASTSSRTDQKKISEPKPSTDELTTTFLESDPSRARPLVPPKDDAVQLASWREPQPGPTTPESLRKKLDLKIPRELPGSEAPEIKISKDRALADRQIRRIYPEPAPLPIEPQVQLGPDGKPLTLADLQRIAAANSPTLRQAVSDVEAAKGNLIQAKTYPNPIISYLVDPSNNNSTAGVQGGAIEQIIRTAGKQRLGVAQAQKDLDNAVLALKRARSDLSTAVRNAYFTLLVDKETLVVTRAVARFTDDIFRIQIGLLRGTQVAPYEPSSLRAQAALSRLAYKQAIFSYVYDWKALVATIGMHQMPLTEVAGQVDRLIPYYDYDAVLAHVLKNHTDILTARNGLRRAQYSLKLAQVTPVPDLDVRMTLEKDFALAPFGTYHALTVGLPLPIWDQNKGNIIAAQAALVRASEEAHRVEVTLTNSLATAYSGYKNNLAALEDYRRNILPDLVRYYRGIYARRQVDPTSPFNDLVTAQQTLSQNVTAYIGILGSLWTSVVSVADFLQTDDLYQLSEPRPLPEVPDLNHLLRLPCGHPGLADPFAVHDGSNSPPALTPDQSLTRSPPAAEPTVQPSPTTPAASSEMKGDAASAGRLQRGIAPATPPSPAPAAPSALTSPFAAGRAAVHDAQGASDIGPAAPAR
jgi:cobalt-zinc-cadmium efflux system outer membrane protein